MKTALLSIIKNAYVGDYPHEATFTITNLDDGSTAPLGMFKRIAVKSESDARNWAAENDIRIINK